MTGRLVGQCLTLLLGLTTLLFFALRAAGDPVVVLAGEGADPELLAALRQAYGLDEPLWRQYLAYLGRAVRLDFGTSLATGEPALRAVLGHLPATLWLACLGMTVTLAVSVPVGVWLGGAPGRPAQRLVAALTICAQGIPGFVSALILIQVFVVQLMWLPSLGYADPRTWILPSLALASFLAPKLIRLIAANVTEAMGQDYVRTARSIGSSPRVVLWGEAFPNAVLATAGLLGAQLSFLVAGAVIIEVLFHWPGLGLLLLQSAQTLDFPVLQAIAFVVAVLVFVVNALTNLTFRMADPRIGSTTG